MKKVELVLTCNDECFIDSISSGQFDAPASRSCWLVCILNAAFVKSPSASNSAIMRAKAVVGNLA